MSGRKVADRPDPAFVATLREGDRVAVAEWGREEFVGVVLRVTPTGLIKVISVSALKPELRYARPFYRSGWGGTWRNSRRYLVPVASSPDSEGGA